MAFNISAVALPVTALRQEGILQDGRSDELAVDRQREGAAHKRIRQHLVPAVKADSHCVGKTPVLNAALDPEHSLLFCRNVRDGVDLTVQEVGILLIDITAYGPADVVEGLPCAFIRRFIEGIFFQDIILPGDDRCDIIGAVSRNRRPVGHRSSIFLRFDLFADRQQRP